MDLVTKEHSEMLDLLLEGNDISNIAKILNKSRPTIYNWLRLEYVQAELEHRKNEIKREARDKINAHVFTYIDNMRDLACNSKDPRVRMQANKYLLDQSIGVPTVAKEDLNTSGNNKPADINDLKKEIDDIKNIKSNSIK